MATERLRAELEAVYNAAVDALKEGDFEAFLAAVQPPVAGSEEAMREHFAEAAPYFSQVIPELSLTTFVTVRTDADDLAGYYHTRMNPFDPSKAQIVLTQFLKVEGHWKLLLSGTFHTFEPDPEQDLRLAARELVDIHPSLQLRRPPTPGS